MERLLRRAVRDLVLITLAIAAAGSAMVAESPREGRALLYAGAAVVLASPWLAYLAILKLYRRKVVEA